jgi:hypothetical protein
MKKIILFLISFIVITSSAQAKVIILSNCTIGDEILIKKKMDKSKFEKNEFIININEKSVRHNIIRTDSYVKESEKIISGFPKFSSAEYQIEYSDSKFVKASSVRTTTTLKTTIEINLNDKTVTETLETKVKTPSDYIYCGGGGIW